MGIVGLADIVKFLRQQKGMGLKDLAEETNIDIGYLHRVENCNAPLSPTVIKTMADAFDISVPEFLNYNVNATKLANIQCDRNNQMIGEKEAMNLLFWPIAGWVLTVFILIIFKIKWLAIIILFGCPVALLIYTLAYSYNQQHLRHAFENKKLIDQEARIKHSIRKSEKKCANNI